MLCFPNAKINIGLNILERRLDQFHNIETLFYPVPLSDILEIIIEEPSNTKVNLHLTGMSVPGDKETNLCTKAYHLLDNDFALPPVKIVLHKIIPMGAGMGGGSSDGAHTLTLLNTMFKLGLGNDVLKDYAARLGSDCPFFIDNKPALGYEKGTVLTPTNLNLTGCYLVIVKPPVFIGTAEAYVGVTPFKPVRPLADLVKQPINLWKDSIKNDFEPSVFEKHPGIKAVKDKLYKQGAIYASMTGSGSAVFGIFETETWLKEEFREMFYWGGWI